MSSSQPASPGDVLAELEAVLRSRIEDPLAGSYSATLMASPQLATRKIMEEAFEVCWELGRDRVDRARCVGEAADLVFHLIAGLVGAGIPLSDVWEELAARRRSPSPARPPRSRPPRARPPEQERS